MKARPLTATSVPVRRSERARFWLARQQDRIAPRLGGAFAGRAHLYRIVAAWGRAIDRRIMRARSWWRETDLLDRVTYASVMSGCVTVLFVVLAGFSAEISRELHYLWLAGVGLVVTSILYWLGRVLASHIST